MYAGMAFIAAVDVVYITCFRKRIRIHLQIEPYYTRSVMGV